MRGLRSWRKKQTSCRLDFFLLLFTDLLLEFGELPLVEDDPFAGVADDGVLQQGAEHHEEADRQVDVQRLHVRDFWQRPEINRYKK